MDFALFKEIIDQIASQNLTRKINLAAIGESLLYPRLLEAIQYCREKKLATSIITNSLLLSNKLYQELADAGLNEIHISFHSLTPESFVYRRSKIPIDYEAFFHNLVALVDYHVSRNLGVRLVINLMFCKKEWVSGELWELPKIKEDTRDAALLLERFNEAMKKIAKKKKTH